MGGWGGWGYPYWDDYYATPDNAPFGFQPVSPLEISFWPLSKPEIVFQESKIKYINAKDLTRDADLGGGTLTLDKLKKIHFLGDTEPEDDEDVKVHLAPASCGA